MYSIIPYSFFEYKDSLHCTHGRHKGLLINSIKQEGGARAATVNAASVRFFNMIDTKKNN
jgi:hypothetical protein